MKKIIVGLIVVAVLVVAVFGVLWVSDAAAATEDVTGDLTVYIEDATTGQMMGAEVKLGQETFVESMMLAFGAGIRQTTFQPLFAATITGINPTAAYNVWVKADIKVEGVNLVSLSSSTVTFTGKSGATGTPALLYNTYVATASGVVITNKLVAGTTTAVDMYNDGAKKFNNVFVSPIIVPGTGVSRPLIGSDINGMVITVTVSATSQAGVTSTVTQTLTITASYASPSLTITVTGISVTSPTSTMISPFLIEDLAATVRS